MKKLPIDIALEGKVKVMQIICDLELKALKRQQEQFSTPPREQQVEQSINLTSTSPSVLNAINSSLITNTPTIGNKPNSNVAASSTSSLNYSNYVSNEQGTDGTNGGNTSRIIGDNISTTPIVPDTYMADSYYSNLWKR